MIRSSKSSSRRNGPPPDATPAAPALPVPNWLRRGIPDARRLATYGIEDAALAAGAAIGALDTVVRRQERWAGAWRQRLALTAASVTARQAGRVEDEAMLRDTVLLTKRGDNVGPGGRMLLAWRRQASEPVEGLLTDASIISVMEDLGFACEEEAVFELADELRQLARTDGMVAMLAGAFLAVERRNFARSLAFWLADVLLAQRLGWPHAVPLLGTEAVLAAGARRSATAIAATGMMDGSERATMLLAGQARAAMRAIDCSAELGRRAKRLLAVAPKLRAKGADLVIERLLAEDAIAASRGDQRVGMSDRALRRLFDRLVDLGAIRELSGRPTFRIYGL